MGAKINKNKRGQLTILIILALIIVVVLALIIGFMQNKNAATVDYSEKPQAYIESCIRDVLQKAEGEILKANGYPNIQDNYILYSSNYAGEKVPYLCKVSLFYTPCINQEPMIIEKIRKDMENLTRKDIEICFTELSTLLKKKGVEVNEDTTNFEINFLGDSISANINKKLTIKKGETTQIFEKFTAKIKSPLYALVDTARNIVNYESATCDFNSLNWELHNPDIQIRKFVSGEQTKIYTLIDKNSAKQFSFAVRTCVLPAGI